MCNVKPIKTAEEFDAALDRVYSLMDSETGSPEGEELDLLGDLVVLYEHRNEPWPVMEGRARIRFWVEEKGWTLQSINELLGDVGDIEQMLAGEEEMSPAAAKILHRHLRIPAAELLRVANIPTPPGIVPPLSTVTRVAPMHAD